MVAILEWEAPRESSLWCEQSKAIIELGVINLHLQPPSSQSVLQQHGTIQKFAEMQSISPPPDLLIWNLHLIKSLGAS